LDVFAIKSEDGNFVGLGFGVRGNTRIDSGVSDVKEIGDQRRRIPSAFPVRLAAAGTGLTKLFCCLFHH